MSKYFKNFCDLMKTGEIRNQNAFFVTGYLRGLIRASIGQGGRHFEGLDSLAEAIASKKNLNPFKCQMSASRLTELWSGYHFLQNAKGGKDYNRITKQLFRAVFAALGIPDDSALREWGIIFEGEKDKEEEFLQNSIPIPEQETLSMRSEKEVAQLEERADRAEKKAEELDQKLSAVISKLDEILKRRLPYQAI